MYHCPDDYLGHILIETLFIIEVSEGVDKESFLVNPILTRAFLRSLEIIGEATKKLPHDFRQQYPEIPWKKMTGMRDKLIHEYFGVDYNLVWDVIINDIPLLHQQIQAILNR
ncbi:DUF86 domain-containing protein [Geminocystis sp. CENA526]|uniref:HepT-like ribonuclease domain-containing protein n=1 Tax=Geminocystis sp. CENA526 TaxID=1355871 RepID=UPI003D6EED4E